MNILLLGAAGQLGQELDPLLQPMGQLVAVDREFDSPHSADRIQQDLSNLHQVEILLNRRNPELIVNACAFTAVDAAESDSELAFRLNADLPGCLARWAGRNQAMVVHYSTDYVFDGESDQPYHEQDETGPLNVYAESKLAGEWALQSVDCRKLLLRTSWVYSSHGKNFVLSMLRLARERPVLKIVEDQVGCPTWARNLAGVTVDLIGQLKQSGSDKHRDGLYHYCDGGVTSWYDFARAIFELGQSLGLLGELPETHPVKSSEYPQAARRPRHSVLDTGKIKREFGIETPGLRQPLQACLMELSDSE